MAPVFVCVCVHVCACVCMTAALNPVTGCGMSSTEIAAEPPPSAPLWCVLPPQERPTSSHTQARTPYTHMQTLTHTSTLCVLQDRDGDGAKLPV